MTDTAFIVQTHYLTPRIRALIERARTQLAHDVHVVGFFPDPEKVPDDFRAEGFHAYFEQDLINPDYPAKGRDQPFQYVPGHCDLLFLRFLRDHPGYRTIWSWEGDVEFTGNLEDFCTEFDAYDSDLACTNIEWPAKKEFRYRDMRHVPPGWPEDMEWPMKCLLGVFRANRAFFDALDRFYRDGGDGHFEWAWTYVAREAGLTFEDFGGNGPFVRPGNRNRFYLRPRYGNLASGTFRFRPFMSKPGRRPNTLYHPVKDRPIPFRERLAQRIRFLRRGLGSVRHGETNYGQPADVNSMVRLGRGRRKNESLSGERSGDSTPSPGGL